MRGKSGDDKNWLLIKHRDQFAAPRVIVATRRRSVLSDRTMEEIAAAGDAVWNSNGGPSGDKSKRATPRRIHFARACVRGPPLISSNRNRSGRAAKRPCPNSRSAIGDIDGRCTRGRSVATRGEIRRLPRARFKDGAHVRLITRNQNDWSARFPQIVAACQKLAVERAVVDGEVVIIGSDGRADFQALQNHMQGKAVGQLTYYVFDLLYADGYSLAAAPLVERKKLLEQIVAALRGLDGVIQISEHRIGHGPITLEEARRAGLEGIMSKCLDSPYRGGRTSDWLKIKCHQRQEFVIGGYMPPKGSRGVLRPTAGFSRTWSRTRILWPRRHGLQRSEPVRNRQVVEEPSGGKVAI